MQFYYVYIVRCADDSYYIGITNDVERRISEHNLGLSPTSFTYKRRPVQLVYSSEFQNVDEAIAWEKHIKRWNRKKKEALIRGDWEALIEYARGQYSKRIRRMTDKVRHHISTLVLALSP